MSPSTRAESSHYTETSRHADVMAFLAALDARGDRRLSRTSFGVSPGGRELPLLVLSAHGVRTPAQARALGLPIVLVMCGIHPGEVEGKEAGLMLVRDLLDRDPDGLLGALTLVVMPLFNPDGNDAIDPGNRALNLPKLSGQLGPESGVGTRVNGAKINLNRDYLRLEAVEMRLWQERVWQVWQPDLTIDNHATNGSVHRFAMTFDIPHTVETGAPGPIRYMREVLTPAVVRAVKATSGYDSGWYGNFVEDERVLDAGGDAQPDSVVAEGWMTYPHHPRFGSNYRGLSGRMDLLLEAYSYITFFDRVQVAYAWMRETLRHVAGSGEAVRAIVSEALAPPERMAVRYGLAAFEAPVEILTRAPRTLTGSPTSVHLPHLGRFVGTHHIQRPAAWIVPARLGAHLQAHGLQVSNAPSRMEVEVATVEGYGHTGGRAILEAAATGDVQVSWRTVEREALPGMVAVSGNQPLAAVAAYLCEPESDDNALENGLVAPPPVGGELPIWRLRS